jgi:hypothetical protein
VFTQHMLKDYYSHLHTHPDTLLCKIFGAFRLKVARPHKQEVHFFIMKNVFLSPPSKPIHVRFDLKGSTYGRRAKQSELIQKVPVLKDLDYFEGVTLPDGRHFPRTYLHLGSKKQILLAQLRADVEFLRRQAILDYSLLVGIHYDRLDEIKKEVENQAHGVAVTGMKGTATHERQTSSSSSGAEERKQSDQPAPATGAPISPLLAMPSPVHRRHSLAHFVSEANATGGGSDATGASQAGSGATGAAGPAAGSGLPQPRVERQQSNYGLKPSKQIAVPRDQLQKATIRLMSPEEKQRVAEYDLRRVKERKQEEEREEEKRRGSVAGGANGSASVIPAPIQVASSSSSSSLFSPAAAPASSSSTVPASRLRGPDGGILSESTSPELDGTEIYYVGIIDILQQWTMLKRFEQTVKTLAVGSADAISCADPYAYASRFLRKMDASFKGDEPPLPEVDETEAGDVTPIAILPSSQLSPPQPLASPNGRQK